MVPRSSATRFASQYKVATCVEKALVEATEISGPACIGKKPPASRTMVLEATLVMAIVGNSNEFTKRNASRVSAVSPDCEIKT